MTAAHFATLAGQARQAAESLKLPSGDSLEHAAELAVYHLRKAASELQKCAEWRAQEEKLEAKP